MKKHILWLFAAFAVAGGGYWAGQVFPAKVALWKSGAVAVAQKPGLPNTAVVTTRDINFAVTAAGDIGPLDAVSVRPEIGGLISKLTLDIAVIGGVAGLLASSGLVNLLSLLSPGDYTPVITVNAMLLGFSFSVCVGVLAGIFPGVKAARLNPIQALRYE